MFKFILMFTKTMAGITMLATGLKGINTMMLKAEMPKENIIVESSVEVIEEQKNAIQEVDVEVEKNVTQNMSSNPNANVVNEKKNTTNNNVSNVTKEKNSKYNKDNINNTNNANNATTATTTTNAVNTNKSNITEQKNKENNQQNNQQKVEEKDNQKIQESESKENTEDKQETIQIEKQEDTTVKQESTKQSERKIEFKQNNEYIEKMKTYISTHETENMKKYGYSFVVDQSIVNYTNPFTYSDFNMSSCVGVTGVYKIYARDYYYNGVYVETQCYVY